MGKPSERGTYQAVVAPGKGHAGLRYRRKVPAISESVVKATASEDNQRDASPATGGTRDTGAESNNQREHESAVAVAPLALDGSVPGSLARDAKKYKKKKNHNAGSPSYDIARSHDADAGGKKESKRKPRRSSPSGKGDRDVRSVQENDGNGADVEAAEDQREPEVVVDVTNASDNGQTAGGIASAMHNAAGLAVDPVPRALHRREPIVEKHKRKQPSRKEDKTGKHKPKQLQWKVKSPQPTASVMKGAPTLAPDSSNRAETFGASKNEADSADEEVDFAARERQLLKMRAKSMSYPLESSSQETQSGSDDDSATFVQFSCPPVLLPSVSAAPTTDEVEPKTLEPSIPTKAPCFPAPFPLERAADLPSSRVHKIRISDFAFHPAEVQIVVGDVVVWHVSNETPAMVEHCLDVTLVRASDSARITSATPALGTGDKFAWHFRDAGTVTVSCSVYDAHGSIGVNRAPASKPVRAVSKRKWTKTKKQKKGKRPSKVRAATDGSITLPKPNEVDKDESEPIEIFHCPSELLHHDGIPDMDAGLCQAVLSQLDAVSNSAIVGVNASSGGVLPVIVVGDVECPISIDAGQEDSGAIAVDSTDDKDTAADEVADFQERVIAMLRRSEEAQAEQRCSFIVDESDFDAMRAYDFFKRRFADVQSSCERVVYL